MITKLYPQGKRKAFNITYDDGVLQDVRFVKLIDSYGIKGTFNLNSQLMYQQFEWVHDSGMIVKRLPSETVRELYKNHEVASHTLTHPYMHHMQKDEIMYQLGQDKYNLEQLFGKEIAGFAVPFDYYSTLIADCAQMCGFEYARMSQESCCYEPSENYYWWQTGMFHLNGQLIQFVDGFFETQQELALCQIVGHSYDLDAEDMWDTMEGVFRRVSEADDIISMTNIEIVRYIRAMRSSYITEDHIINNSDKELWFDADGTIVCVGAGESYKLH